MPQVSIKINIDDLKEEPAFEEPKSFEMPCQIKEQPEFIKIEEPVADPVEESTIEESQTVEEVVVQH